VAEVEGSVYEGRARVFLIFRKSIDQLDFTKWENSMADKME
jgi:hypothetical protein